MTKIITRAIKLDLTFFIFGVLFLKFSLVFLKQKKITRRTNRNNPKWASWQPLMPEFFNRHAQQQDKLNAKRLIHGICSILRLFLYQINTKFVLTVSRRIHFLSSIHQHLSHAPQKKKTNKCEETWRHRDATTAALQQIKLDSSSSENTSPEIRPISCVLGVSSDEVDDVAQRSYRQQGVKHFARFA